MAPPPLTPVSAGGPPGMGMRVGMAPPPLMMPQPASSLGQPLRASSMPAMAPPPLTPVSGGMAPPPLAGGGPPPAYAGAGAAAPPAMGGVPGGMAPPPIGAPPTGMMSPAARANSMPATPGTGGRRRYPSQSAAGNPYGAPPGMPGTPGRAGAGPAGAAGAASPGGGGGHGLTANSPRPSAAPVVAGGLSRSVDLLATKTVLPSAPVKAPVPALPDSHRRRNCSSRVIRSSLTKVPNTQKLLSKSKLPFGIEIYPLGPEPVPVIESTIITRCRMCRTYMNPFVSFTSHGRRWRCNMCYRVQDLPADFDYDPVKRAHVERSERPELTSSTVEYIAPQEYMVRAPQPCINLFLIDVSNEAVARGMVESVAKTIGESLPKFSGDKRTKIGFITYDDQLHFYNLNPKLTQPQMMVVPEIDDVFLPCPTDLIVNLEDSMDLVAQLMESLPGLHAGKTSTGSCLGSAMEAARVMLGNMGGRLTIFQASRPNVGKGALPMRDDPSARGTSKESELLNMGTDFYKKFAVDASRAQIGCDLFLFNETYLDMASLGQAAKFGAGMVFYYPRFKSTLVPMAEKIRKDLSHYLTKSTGLEAVLRLRCTRGIVMDVFHGHFFVRSQDLLCLPNASPDNGISFQLALEEDLPENQPFCFFQTALLYTSGSGQRRIRVHTYALPTTSDLADVYNGIDAQCMASLLTKMAVDRALNSTLNSARDSMMNALVDSLSVYRQAFATPGSTALVVPESMRLLPLYINAAMRHRAFSNSVPCRTDERTHAMILMKVLPLWESREYLYPRLYALHNMEPSVGVTDAKKRLPMPVLHQLTAANLQRGGLHLLYNGQELLLWVSRELPAALCQEVFKVNTYAEIPSGYQELPLPLRRTSSSTSVDGGDGGAAAAAPTLAKKISNIIRGLRKVHPRHMMLRIIKEDAADRQYFLDQLVEDRSTAKDPSYYEFLQMLQSKMK